MTVKVKLSQTDFLKANIAVLLKKPFIIVFICIFLFNIIFSVTSGVVNGNTSLSQILPFLIILILFSAVMFFTIKRNYTSNKRSGETIEYTFYDSSLYMQGESFRSELSWDKIYKVTAGKKWLFIWQNRQIANAIPVAVLSKSDWAFIKNILTKNQVKNNLSRFL